MLSAMGVAAAGCAGESDLTSADAGAGATADDGCAIGEALGAEACTVYVATGGTPCERDASGAIVRCPTGTAGDEFAGLQDLHDALPDPGESAWTRDWLIQVRAGTYAGVGLVEWTKSDQSGAGHRVTIASHGGRAVMDGLGQPTAFLHLSCTRNVTVTGLTIQHYYSAGIWVGGESCAAPARSAGNAVTFNVVQYIGSTQKPACGNKGYEGVAIVESEDNDVAHNQFVHLENMSEPHPDGHGEAEFQLIHAVYLDSASGNRVEDNFVDLCTGAPFKVRDASNNNLFRRNYVNRSGSESSLNAWSASDERPSFGNQLAQNVITFPYPSTGAVLALCGGAGTPSCRSPDQLVVSGNHFVPAEPASEVVKAMTSADVDGDGAEETFVALEYPGLTKVVRTGASPWLSELVYHDSSATVAALTGGNFDGAGSAEIVTAFEIGGATEVYRGTGLVSDARIGLTDLGLLYRDTDRRVTAMAAGDVDRDGRDDLFTALTGGGSRVVRGDGTGRGTGVTGGGDVLADLREHEVPVALVVGDFDGDGAPELYGALDRAGHTRIVRDSGSGDPPISISASRVLAMAAHEGERDGRDELLLAVEDRGEVRVDRCDGTTGAVLSILFADPSGIWVPVAVARRRSPAGQDLVTTLLAPDHQATEIWSGDGTGSVTGVARHYASRFDASSNAYPRRICP